MIINFCEDHISITMGALIISPSPIYCSGTTEGNIMIISSSNMRVHTYVKKAHLGFVTASAFSLDSRFEVLYVSL